MASLRLLSLTVILGSQVIFGLRSVPSLILNVLCPRLSIHNQMAKLSVLTVP